MTNLLTFLNASKWVCHYKPFSRLSIARYSAKLPQTTSEEEFVKDEDEAEKIAAAMFNEVDIEALETEIEQKRNKSGLREPHRRIINNQMPYDKPHSWAHTTLKYKRTMYGRYGAASGIDPRLLFPTEEERAEKQEYEKVAYPKSLKQMIANIKQRKINETAAIAAREKEIDEKFIRQQEWTKEYYAKLAKREADALAALERKHKMINEVRKHFGFKIDQKDPRFQEMIEKKNIAERAAKKASKKGKLEEKLVAKILQNSKLAEQESSGEKQATEQESTESVIRETEPLGRRGKKKQREKELKAQAKEYRGRPVQKEEDDD